MNRNDYLNLLEQFDDQTDLEVPGGWENYDYEQAHMKFLSLRDQINFITSYECEYESGSYVQDASFIGDILIPQNLLVEQGKFSKIRVSHFGCFVTIWGEPADGDQQIIEGYRTKIMNAIQSQGYIYIPPEILELEYEKNEWISDWGHRYFSYL